MDARDNTGTTSDPAYRLDDQIGFILRQVMQRHAGIFATGVDNELTATQWAAMSKIHEVGPLSQNLLGRLTVMDGATIKGVIDRLTQRGLTCTSPDASDGRRRLVALTPTGAATVARLIPTALRITDETLAPLETDERRMLVAMLSKMR